MARAVSVRPLKDVLVSNSPSKVPSTTNDLAVLPTLFLLRAKDNPKDKFLKVTSATAKDRMVTSTHSNPGSNSNSTGNEGSVLGWTTFFDAVVVL